MQHLAIIPDGNRRWAAANKLESFFGHSKGLDVVKTAIKFCLDKGIKYLSLYTFSLENFKRSELEKRYLFDMLNKEFRRALPDLKAQGVRVRFVGDRAYFPAAISETIALVEGQTAECSALNLNLLFCYGSRQEMAQAVRTIAQQVKDGSLKLEDINEEMLSSSLWTSGMPDPDLIIRTGKTPRLSNYLLYQAAYSEVMFLDCFWPEVTEKVLADCLDSFVSIKRNFGA